MCAEGAGLRPFRPAAVAPLAWQVPSAGGGGSDGSGVAEDGFELGQQVGSVLLLLAFGGQLLGCGGKDVADLGEELVGVEGLGHVAVGTEVVALLPVPLGSLGGQDEDLGELEQALLPEGLEDLVAVQLRHHDVEDQQIGRGFLDVLDGLEAILGDGHLVALVRERVDDQLADIRIVVCYEDPSHLTPRCAAAPGPHAPHRRASASTLADLSAMTRFTDSISDVIDSAIPRFSQAIQAVLLALAFLVEARWLVPALGLVLLAAVAGGPRWNLLGRIYRGLNLPSSEPEPAAPPRFAQLLGTIFLAVATAGLFVADTGTRPYWLIGWGAALIVAALAAIAATTRF